MPTVIQPLDLLDAQTIQPTELRTAELSRLSQWTRERAFYMAGVTRAEIVQEMRDIVRADAAGEAGEYELRKRWESFLDGVGYTPLPGQEGTIKDLRSLRRFNVALRTNRRLMNGWALKENGRRRGPLLASPGWELVRIREARVPRAWTERFVNAGGELYEGRPIAPKLSDVWASLGSVDFFDDALGVDYPPFAWGSGMSWRPVGAREMVRLGVLSLDEIREQAGAAESAPVSSPNESLQTRPRVNDRDLRDRLAEELGGLAEWSEEDPRVLVMADPNGTRPGTAEKIAATITAPLPTDRATGLPFPRLQAEAVAKWVEDHRQFDRERLPDGSTREAEVPWGSDVAEDLLRAVSRILPYRAGPVWRGMAWSSREKFQQFVARLESRGYAPLDTKLLDSWSVAESGARKYAAAKRYRAVLEVAEPREAREIAPLARALVKEGLVRSPNPAMPLSTDGEAVYLRGARFRVVNVNRISPTEARIQLEEVPR